MRRFPSGLARRTISVGAPFSSNSSSGRYERNQVSSSRRWSSLPFTPDKGTWCERQLPRTWMPSTLSGPVHPFGVRRMINGHLGRAPSHPPPRADAWMERIVALDLDHVVPVSGEQRADLLRVLACEHGGTRDLRAVEMQDGEYRTVALGVEERDALPGPLERTGLRLAVSHHRQCDEVRVVHGRPEGVDEDVPELSTLLDGPRRRHRDMARDATRSRELAKEAS